MRSRVAQHLASGAGAFDLRLGGVAQAAESRTCQLRASIEQKLQAEQQSEQMRFVLDRERQEAERKRIEAQGIADFQRIVTGFNQRGYQLQFAFVASAV